MKKKIKNKKMQTLSIYLGVLGVIMIVAGVIGHYHYSKKEKNLEYNYDDEFYLESKSGRNVLTGEQLLLTNLFFNDKQIWASVDKYINLTSFTIDKRLAEARLFAIEYKIETLKSEELLNEAKQIIK